MQLCLRYDVTIFPMKVLSIYKVCISNTPKKLASRSSSCLPFWASQFIGLFLIQELQEIGMTNLFGAVQDPIPPLNAMVLSSMDNIDIPLGNVLDGGKKLAILGLPWDTSEETLRAYFSQFGPMDHVEVMKDRYTGKSRGFGFVSFLESSSAMRALNTEHLIDGRRCEAKVALPKGEPTPPRTTRIFVARIPPSVSEVQFRSYFEGFGKLQDAYMPRDHSKQGYRGIGFVTYASADSVEKVVAVKHWLNGHEIAIDRATPKEEPSVPPRPPPAAGSMMVFNRVPSGPTVRRSFDNGANIIGPGLLNVTQGNVGLRAFEPAAGGSYSGLRSLSEDRELGVIGGGGGGGSRLDPVMELMNSGGSFSAVAEGGMQQDLMHSSQNLGLSLGFNHLGGIPNAAASSLAAAAAASNVMAYQSLQHAQVQQQQQAESLAAGIAGLGLHPSAMHSHQHLSGMHHPHQGLPEDMASSFLTNAFSKAGALGALNHQHAAAAAAHLNVMPEMNAAVQQLMAAAAVQNQGRRSLDAATAHMKRLENGMRSSIDNNNPAIMNARAGPRIFIGKLTKETSETDVREYFGRFGYVMDVYLPKAKDNKSEHRGFGFVTFETEAAIQRVVQHGPHRLKGSTIAIDIAMPKVVEEESMLLDSNNSLENARTSCTGGGNQTAVGYAQTLQQQLGILSQRI
ncbi:hypothetical protein CEUSTIGMA_g5123.t1 [Chlamydomonas eustigma]|uniref:RRM domain-containing protein n=1 Tax=Chlamydomonas eustigma TaxID=1157962 RepID=A0A250X4K0_9CHLO|nr:hypothetical protein CEUSTIGMA_g5123.t1 [Chlamydomonas eustigma]|eukprot:GAX77680.1 hypothetical protein CEUSTIGMA_g5123.t1 [Chlamydomonas eustigma]